MESLTQSKQKRNSVQNESTDNSKIKIEKINEDTPINNNKKDNSYGTKKAGIFEEIIKSNEDFKSSYSERSRKFSIKKKNKIKDSESSKDISMIVKEGKKPSNINRKIKKKPKTNIVRKPRRDVNIGGTIKVVGKISAKLESLIQRLGQYAFNANNTNRKTENKYVMGPRIKAALEKFNKKKEEQSPITSFTGTKFKSVVIPDSDKGLKSNHPFLGKIRYIKEIDEDQSEDDESEEDEEEDESGKDSKGKKTKKFRKDTKGASSKKGNNNDKSNSDKKKKKKRNKKEKSQSKILKLSHDDSSVSEDSHKKQRIKKHKKGNNSISSDSEESEEKKVADSNGDDLVKRKFSRHKSGKGSLVVKHKIESRSISSSNSNSSSQSNDRNKNSSSLNKGHSSKNNPINIKNSNKDKLDDNNTIFIKKKFVKNVEYDKFSYKQYKVKNYQSKPYAVWKKQVKEYVLSKQIDFSIISRKKKKAGSKKAVMFNVNNNDFNKRKNNNNRFGARKSLCPTFNNSSLHNFAKKFDISKYEEKLSNIKKMKNNLINEKKNINTEFAKRRKRYQSILLTEDKTFNDFSKKINKSNNDSQQLQKNKLTNPRKRMSVMEIFHKRGFNTSFLENLKTEPNTEKNIKKNNFNFRSGINYKFNKDKGTKLEEIAEKEEDVIKQTHFGVKYIVFQNKNELKTIHKKEKWNLVISDTYSIFLKAIRGKEDIDKKNIKNNTESEKIYKNYFDNENKIETISLNFTADKRKDSKNKEISNEKKENSRSSSSSSSSSSSASHYSISNKNNNETLNKSTDAQKISNKNENKSSYNEKLFNNLVSNIQYNKDIKKSDKNILKSINSGSNINESQNPLDDFNYLSDNYNRTYKYNMNIQLRKKNNNNNYTLEEKERKIGKVKSKKAKIKKFKSINDEPDTIDDERRRKGNLYDYYSSKIPKKRKNYLKNEKEKEFTINTRDNKNILGYNFDFNNNNQKAETFRRCNSGKNNNKFYRNYSSNKKHKRQINPVEQYVNSNPSLITNYRKKIFEGLSNKNSNLNVKVDNKNVVNKSMSALRRKNDIKIKLNASMEMLKIDAIKSKMKKRLIEINNKLLDAVHYYNGPIDISCISLKNYKQTVEDLSKRALKNGYKCTKFETNYYELSNGLNTFFVEIVKIRNNMLYYLIVKN